MKKVLSFILLIFLVLSTLTGCDIPKKDIKNKLTSQPQVSANIQPAPESAISSRVLFEKDNIKITAESMTLKASLFTSGPALKLLIENNTNKNIYVDVRDTSVNDIMINLIGFREVSAGKKSNQSLVFNSTELNESGIKTIKDIEFKLSIMEAKNYEVLTESDIIKISLDVDPSFSQTYNDKGVPALDKSGFKIVAVNSDINILDPFVKFYVENNTDQAVNIQAANVSVNGSNVENFLYSEILPGKKAYVNMILIRDDLTKNNIKKIENLEMTFVFTKVIDYSKFDPDDFLLTTGSTPMDIMEDPIFTSDVVKIKF